MTESSNVELYLQLLENELHQADVPCTRWKSILTPHLTPALKDHIGDLQADPTKSYDDIKARLLDRSGQTALRVGVRAF